MTRTFKDFAAASLYLGYQGENGVMRLTFDINDVLQPGWTAALNLKRPGEDTYYPVVSSLVGGVLTYFVNSADTAISGLGEAELFIYGEDGKLKKSAITQTIIERAFTTAGEAPEPIEEWTTAANLKLADVQRTLDLMADASASAETVAAGLPAGVAFDATDWSFHFYIPKGEKGDKGNVMFATFAINPLTGNLAMTTPDEYDGATFSINNSYLEVTV